MKEHDPDAIRNIALLGHSGAGKTLICEALLVASGATGAPGQIERGNTLSDFDPLEKQRGHSLNTAVVNIHHQDCHIQIIDTPGLQDFRGPTLSAMSAVETAAVVINAQAGIEQGTVRLMQRAKERGLCRMIIVNKIDIEDLDLKQLVDDIRTNFGDECMPLNLPAGDKVVDCFFNPQGESDLGPIEHAHQQVIDQVVEVDDEVMEHYLEGGEEQLTAEELHDSFEKSLREGHLVPICFVSARSGVGVRQLLNICVRLLPNPSEGNPPAFLVGEQGQEVHAVPDPAAHVVAHVFRVSNDPFVGKMGLMRVYQGTVRKDAALYIGDGRKPIRVAHLYRMHGKEYTEISEAVPGELCALAKIDELHYDAVLHDSHDEDHWHLRPLDFPQPMFGLAIAPLSHGHEQKLSLALHRLAEEDPCISVEHHVELNETVIRGLGELHLKVMLERMQSRYGIEVSTSPPRIAYRETISTEAEGHYRHKKQTGGAGQFGEVSLRVRPLERGDGFRFVNGVVGGAIPHNLIPAVEKGVLQVMQSGAIAGFPLQDIEVTVYDGKHHSVDSKEIAFVIAARKAFSDAVLAARPQVLEPIVGIEVVADEGHMGDIASNLAAKRARINGTDSAGSGQISVRALVPLAELVQFQTELKAMTAGLGRYQLEPSHYEPVPPPVQKQLVGAWQPHEHEDH